ncbi:MAG: ROK family protein [Roseburia sp.]|nr:ROK family protein [Roseburia sp.]MCM1098170.1 ROK family protein [Ruminococcus flavefaciens]
MKKYSIGVDIGGTKCAVVLGKGRLPEKESDSFILDKIKFPTEAEKGPEQTIRRICEAVSSLLKRNQVKAEEAVGIGVSCGGPLDHRKGIVLNPPNLYGWDHIPIADILEKKFGIRTFLENDANACGLAEWRFGAARGYRNIVFLTCGTGLGAGLILDGRLYHGSCGMAGEAGHVRLSPEGPVGYGKAGSFEGFCSGGGIAQIARTKVLEKLQMGERPPLCPDVEGLQALSAKTVAEAAKAGDALAGEIYRISGRYLGRGLAILIDILNPEVIVLGSIYERAEELLLPGVSEILEKEALEISRRSCRIVPAGLGEQIGDYAALSVAFGEDWGEAGDNEEE